MHCEEAREAIADKLARTLAADAESQLGEHLAKCSVCRDEFAEMERIWAGLGTIAVPPMEASNVRRAVLGAASVSGWRFFGRRFTMKEALRAAAVIVVVASLAAGASLWLGRRAESLATDSSAVRGQVLGKADAPITLVEYGDYECPPCASFAPVVRKLLEKYPDSLKYEFRHFPLTGLHPGAMRAAVAAEAAGQQGKFWEMHKLLLANQGKLIRDPDAENDLVELGKLIDVDAESFDKSLRSIDVERKIAKQVAQAKTEGISGVPTFLINGTKIEQNPNSFDGFDALIMDELKKLKLQRARELEPLEGK
jgi:protein-disulfide isomerase